MEQIFNPKRFIRYANYQITANKKSTLLILAGSFISIFLFIFILVSNRAIRNDNEWMGAFWGTSITCALLLIGHSFPALRKNKSTINFLTAPASVFEKFTFEILIKIVLFAAIYPFVFKLIGELAVNLADFVFPKRNHFEFTYTGLAKFSNENFFPLIQWLIVFGVSIAFAGATAFKKLPLLKTIVFLGLVIGAITGYFYLLVEHWELGKAIGEFMEESWISKEEDAIFAGTLILAISSLVAFVYAYFNLKEREV